MVSRARCHDALNLLVAVSRDAFAEHAAEDHAHDLDQDEADADADDKASVVGELSGRQVQAALSEKGGVGSVALFDGAEVVSSGYSAAATGRDGFVVVRSYPYFVLKVRFRSVYSAAFQGLLNLVNDFLVIDVSILRVVVVGNVRLNLALKSLAHRIVDLSLVDQRDDDRHNFSHENQNQQDGVDNKEGTVLLEGSEAAEEPEDEDKHAEDHHH